ncbi:5'/3'-nucleotidase SurE [soil metagenome]
MRILITNDDGIRAPGLTALADVAKKYGEVKIVAPEREMSCCGHGMTMREPLRVSNFTWDGCEAFEVNGTPTDCVNIGMMVGWPDGCDLVLSGFNRGPNLGFDVTYSGTVAGAMEGCLNGARSFALSMAQFVSDSPVHFDTGARWLDENWEQLMASPSEELNFVNINVPNIAYPELRGHRVVGMGRRVYKNRVEPRTDPWGRPYYWQGGVVAMDEPQPGTDVDAVNQGFVSITPIALDWTNVDLADKIRASMKKA